MSLTIFTERKKPAYNILSLWLQMWGEGNFIHFRLDTIAMYVFFTMNNECFFSHSNAAVWPAVCQ